MKLWAYQLGISVGKHRNQFQLHYASTVYLEDRKNRLTHIESNQREREGERDKRPEELHAVQHSI